MSTTWSSSDTRHQPDDLSEITKKLEKVKTEQDQRDDSERAEADAAMDWDGRQYRIDPREAQVEKIKDVSMAEKDVEPIFIEFEEGDPANPFNWPNSKKWRITFITTWFTFLVAFAGASFPIGIPDMERDLNVTTHELSLLAISIYPFGFGVLPLVTAPFSEIYGRNSLYLITFFLWMVFMLPTGLAPNMAAVIIGRFLAGAAGSTGSTVVGGTLADIWVTSERGRPMAVFSSAAFIGTGLAPATMGFVAQELSWRWIQYIQVIVAAVTYVVMILVLRETRGSVLLSRRAKKMRADTGDERYQCRADAERASLSVLIKISLMRPLSFLVREPVVTFMSIWVGFAWLVMWGLLPAVSLVMRAQYGFNTGITGLCFLSLAVGAAIAFAFNSVQERLYRQNVAKRGPEARLYLACVGGLALPVGGLIFGFTQGRTHWIGPTVGLAVIMFGIYHIYVAVFNYLSDSYLMYASSAIAAQSFARNMAGAAFPLFVEYMYNGMGFTWASFLISMIGLLLGLTPFVLFFKGKDIRLKSKVLQEVQRLHEQQQQRMAKYQESSRNNSRGPSRRASQDQLNRPNPPIATKA